MLFGMIQGPESSQKKRYEQLRLRSIDWQCQMVGLTIERWLNQNQGLGFWIGRKFLTADFLMLWLGFSLLKHDFGLQK